MSGKVEDAPTTVLPTATNRAWRDDDDDETPLEVSSRVQPGWVEAATTIKKRQREDADLGLDDDGTQLADNPLDLATTAPLLEANNKGLTARTLRYQRLPDANKDVRREVGVFTHQYTPNGQCMVAVGPDRNLQIYRNDGADCTYLQDVAMEGVPAYNCRFIHRGDRVLCTGRQSSFAEVDLTTLTSRTIHKCGFQERDISVFDAEVYGHRVGFSSRVCGVVHMVDTRTYRLSGTVRVNEPVAAVQFATPSGSSSDYMWVCSGDTVHLWDLRAQSAGAVMSHMDPEGVRITSFHATESYHAVGTDSGVVSVYNNDWTIAEKALAPKPLCTAKNLLTAISSVQFNHDSRLLAYASDKTKNAFRMLHVPSGTTYENFPRAIQKSIGRVLSLGFTPNSAIASAGSSQGRILRYRLNAFDL
eukprot:PhM_4_TR13038/c0_g1_i1/m.92436/K14553/UTP18; U3 small nucleolar RNA-associated protein 18